jgi:hypothetical protein
VADVNNMAVVIRLAALEAQMKNVSFGGRFKDLSLAACIREWSGSDKGKSVTELRLVVGQQTTRQTL